MALVNVVNMVVLDNPTCFTSPFQFEITFECLQELDDDLEWKVLYVGSAQDAAKDQILDEILVGPVPVGVNKFVLQADAPDPSQLAQDDLLGVTVVLVTCSYKEREFVRVGYYVNNEYHDPNSIATTTATATISQTASGSQTQTEEAAPPVVPNPVPLDRIQRQILADKPRVTKFPISWGDEPQQQQQHQQYQQQQHQQQHPMPQSAAGVTGSSVGAAMMADHAAATGGIGIPSPAPVVTPTISNHHDASAAAAASDNANVHAGDNSNIHESSMREEGYNGEEELMEEDEEDDDDDNGENDIDDDEGEEDIMDEEELSVDSETGERAGEGIVSMPEESNMSHAYFGHSSTSGGNTTAAANNNNNVEAMAE